MKVGSQGKALSVSMGVYVPEDDDLAYRDVFVKADEALYRAKRSGKNRIASTAARVFCDFRHSDCKRQSLISLPS